MKRSKTEDEGSVETAEDAALAAEAQPELREPTRRVHYEGLPLVVIAGRPNAGKSTLYNRLLHKRRAITDPTPGVTRDPVDAVCDIGRSGKRCVLVDTGGFKIEREGLDAQVIEKALEYLERADLIVFLLDASRRTPEDEEFSALLRKWSSKVLVVVNKVDSPERDERAWANAERGFGHVVFVSAEHGRNMDELESCMIARLDFSKASEVEEARDPIRLAIMGKPNTGKSTLLNRLLGTERSIVSEVAGTTRDVVEGRFVFKGRQVVVLDTAGIRRKKKVTESVEYYSVNRAIRTVEDSDVVVLMIDAREGLTEQDKKIAGFATEKGRALVFALNKWDEMPDLKNSFEAARDKLRYFFGQMAWAPVLPLSAKEGSGVDKLMNTVVSLHAQLNRKIETSRLNKAFAEWVEATPPPIGTRTRFKVRYAVQTSVNPQGFVVFVTRPDAVTEAYVSFLRNKIRAELGLDKIPLTLELKASRVPITAKPASRADRVKESAAQGGRRLKAGERPAPKPRIVNLSDAKKAPGLRSRGSKSGGLKDEGVKTGVARSRKPASTGPKAGIAKQRAAKAGAPKKRVEKRESTKRQAPRSKPSKGREEPRRGR
jgi:GTP-binding protein